jgi:hypothetical protein
VSDKTRLENLKTTIKFVSKQVLLNFAFIFVIIIIGNEFKPEVISLNNDYFIIILVLILFRVFIKGISFGRALYESFNRGDYIGRIKHERTDPIRHIKRSISSLELSIEENKERLNLIKAFSPIPILVFILGMFLDKKTGLGVDEDLVNEFLGINSLSLNMDNWFMLFSFAFIILYFVKVGSAWTQYKSALRFLRELKSELIYLESEEYQEKISRKSNFMGV